MALALSAIHLHTVEAAGSDPATPTESSVGCNQTQSRSVTSPTGCRKATSSPLPRADVLGFGEETQRVLSALATDPGIFHATEGHPDIPH
jgi:hypothetical protein